MNYQPISLRCNCGARPARFEEVGLSSAHELVIHWWCEACQRVRFKAMPLEECVRECPPPEETAHEADARFLSRLGIRG